MDEPTQPAERARFIVKRIAAAVGDFGRVYPRLPAAAPAAVKRAPAPTILGEWVPARFAWDGGRRWRVVPAHYEPAAEVDWSLSTPAALEASAALAGTLCDYAEGKAGLDEVKGAYQRHARAHLVYWLHGRLFTDELAARLALAEGVSDGLIR